MVELWAKIESCTTEFAWLTDAAEVPLRPGYFTLSKPHSWTGAYWETLMPFQAKFAPTDVKARGRSEISVVPAVGSEPT